MLFNIFINDLIGFIKKSSLYNFADDNTITAFEKDITLLKETLQNEAEIAIQWFKDNFMIVNPGKFQAMVINRFGKMENKHEMYIENKKITSEHSVKLLGIEIDNQLNFDNHVSTLCKKAGSQLNAIGRLKKYIGFPEKKALIEAFVFLNFNYCPLVWHFTSMGSTNKIEPIQKKALQLLYNDYTCTNDGLLAKANKPSMEIKRYRTLVLEMQITHVWNEKPITGTSDLELFTRTHKSRNFTHIFEVCLILGLLKNASATCASIPEHSKIDQLLFRYGLLLLLGLLPFLFFFFFFFDDFNLCYCN